MAKSAWQTKMENLFKNQGQAIVERPMLTLVLCILCVIGATYEIINIRFDSSIESFLSKDHPATISIEENRKHFGFTDLVVVGVQSPDLFSTCRPPCVSCKSIVKTPKSVCDAAPKRSCFSSSVLIGG